jgi:hypothetical protein
MQCIDRLNEACLPAGDLLLPTEEPRLPTVRCASYEWTKVFFHLEEVHWTCIRIASPDGCSTSDDRSTTSPEWEKIVVHVEEPHRTCVQVAACDGVHPAGRRIVHVFRAGEDVLPAGRSASDAPTHHGPRWRAPRRRIHRGRLPVQEPFLPGACSAMHDPKEQCPRA